MIEETELEAVGLFGVTAEEQSSAPRQGVCRRWTLPGIGMAGLACLVFYAAVALAAPLLAPHDPYSQAARTLQPPSAPHLLGTNDVGQDIFSELIYGARVTLGVSLLAALVAVALGTFVGSLSGYMGGLIDQVLTRFLDVLFVIPRLPLMILLVALLGASLRNVVLVIALLGWPVTARISRAQALSLRSRGYIRASRGYGGGVVYIVRRHLLPALGPIAVAEFVTTAGRAALLESGLSFLGLGDPTTKSWGTMLYYALRSSGIFFTQRWLWWVLPAGLNITLLILGFAFLGVGLETRLDPRLRRGA